MIFKKIKFAEIGFFRLIFLLTIGLLVAQKLMAQDMGQVHYLMQQGAYQKALPILKKSYRLAPFDKAIYSTYLTALIKTRQYEQADSLVQFMMKIRRDDPAMLIDRGRVAAANNHKREAKKFYNAALEKPIDNNFQIRSLAEAFDHAGLQDYAIRTYLKARETQHNPYAFATELALLYNQQGNYKKAIGALLDKAMNQVGIQDDLHDALLGIMQKDKKGLQEIQKSLNERLKENPKNPVWQQLLAWTYSQDGDYAGAFKNLKKLDKAFSEKGERLIPFAQNAMKAGRYNLAEEAYDYVLKMGKDQPYFGAASAGKLITALHQLEAQNSPSPAQINALLQQFRDFFQNYPQYKITPVWRHYAMVQARYNNQPDSAIALLKEVIKNPRASDKFRGQCKLDMGDDYLLAGKIWNATLMYRQVNQDFLQDRLGELARFKNAQWAFYKGDFKLAQQQLSVLKASTSKLIANDALYLSILITENTPPDSNTIPLKKFAEADLLLFKHQTRQADRLLDSISKAWPQSPLQDDIAMLRGKTAAAAANWQKAIVYYKIVLDNYGQDILGDDAAWHLAELYRKQLKEPANAAKYYKIIILKYPGSTFVQEARKWYQQCSLQTKKLDS